MMKAVLLGAVSTERGPSGTLQRNKAVTGYAAFYRCAAGIGLVLTSWKSRRSTMRDNGGLALLICECSAREESISSGKDELIEVHQLRTAS